MAAELGSAYISVGLGTNKLTGDIKRAFSGAGADGGAAGKAAGSGFAGGFKGLVGPAIAAVSAIGFGGLVAEAARASDATDKFKSTMNFAGIDASGIEAATAAAKAYADQTVYDLPTIQATMAQLASNGVKDYKGLTEAAGNLNAVAGGNAETFKSVSRAVTQSAGAGKLMTEDWNMLADAIPGASGPLQNAMREAGAFEGNFKKAMESGEISSEEFQAALDKLGSDPIAVEAARSVTTFEGALGNLEATVNSGLMSALDALKPVITDAINLLSNGLGAAFEWTGKAATGLYDLLVKGDFTGAFRDAFHVEEDSALVDFLFDARDAVKGLMDAFKSGNGATGIADFFTTIIASSAGMRDQLINTVATAIPGIIGKIVAAAPAILTAAVQSFSSLITAVITTVPPLLTAILGMLPQIIATLLSLLPMLLGAGLQLFTGLIQALVQVLPQIATTLVTMLPQISAALVGMLPQIVTAGLALFMGIVDGLVLLLPILIKAVMDVLPVLISTLLGMLPQIISAGLELFLGVVTGLLKAAPTIIKSLLGMLPQIIATLLGMIPQLIQAAVQLFNGLARALPIILPQLIGALLDIAPVIVSTLIGMVPMLFDVGTQIIQGLIDGVGSMIGSAVQAVKDVGGSMLSGIQDFLGIKSPSRVFKAEVGMMIGAGLIQGLDASQRGVAASVNRLVPIPSVSAYRAGAYSPAGAVGGNSGGGDVNFYGPVGWDPDRVAQEIEVRKRRSQTMAGMGGVVFA